MKNGWTIYDIDFSRDKVERRSCVGKYAPCLKCGKRGKRIGKHTKKRVIRHIAYSQKAWIIAEQGQYKARCGCCTTFWGIIPGVPRQGEYSDAVRVAVIKSMQRDRLPGEMVKERLKEDFLLEVSTGFIYACFDRAVQMVDQKKHWQWVCENFSGVLCIDEVHDSKDRKILFATDPINNFTVAFAVVEKNSQEEMDKFLEMLKAHGITPVVVITDGSPLYRDALTACWEDVEHQLCIFHVLADINKVVLDGVRSIKNKIKRQGNKGRKRRRGRPKGNRKKPQRETRKDQARFIWDNQHLVVKKKLTRSDRKKLKRMYTMAPELKILRDFITDVHRLFEKDITKQQARNRHTRLMHNPAYQKNPFLVRAMKKLKTEKFEKMIVFMDYENVDRTSNHVERNNRSFRMSQKTRYKRRRRHTIEAALWLEMDARRKKHPLSIADSTTGLDENHRRRAAA